MDALSPPRPVPGPAAAPDQAAAELDRLAGRSVQAWREHRGLSRAALGKACGVSGQQIEKYETAANRMSLSRFARIADALGVTPDQLWSEAQGTRPALRPAPPSHAVKAAKLARFARGMDEAALDDLMAIARRLAS